MFIIGRPHRLSVFFVYLFFSLSFAWQCGCNCLGWFCVCVFIVQCAMCIDDSHFVAKCFQLFPINFPPSFDRESLLGRKQFLLCLIAILSMIENYIYSKLNGKTFQMFTRHPESMQNICFPPIHMMAKQTDCGNTIFI